MSRGHWGRRPALRSSPFVKSIPNLKAIPPPSDKARADAEQKLRDAIEKILREHGDEYARKLKTGEASPDLSQLEKDLNAEIEQQLARTAFEQMLESASQFGVEYDTAAIDRAAHEWAKQYTYDLVKDITDRTRTGLQAAISQFIEAQGMTFGDLKELLEPMFGVVRADRIATTETTRAYAQAQSIYKQELARDGIQMERVWHTDKSDSVCGICRSLDGQVENENGEFYSNFNNQYYKMPVDPHIGCGCGIGLRVKR